VLLTIYYGVYPAPILDVTAVSVKKLVSAYEAAIKTAELLPR
jgi:NADH-quinone oxidoreductase subunit M